MLSGPTIQLKNLQVFVAICELGRFADAARLYGTSRAAVTHQIQQLESCLGATLFIRTTVHVELTEVGRIILPLAKQAMDLNREIILSANRAHRDGLSSAPAKE